MNGIWKVIVNQGDGLYEQEVEPVSQAKEIVLLLLSLVNESVRENGAEGNGTCLRISMENESLNAYGYVQVEMET